MKKKRLGTEPKARQRWSAGEDELFISLYPDHTNDYIAEMLHRSVHSVQMRAVKLGLRKSPEFAEQRKRQSQFKKGHTPFNKGKQWKYYMSPDAMERAKSSQFKAGDVGRKSSPTYRPVGYESVRISKGRPYIHIKVAIGKKMVMKHRYVYEQAHGPIPKGHNVIFKDGNTMNCSLDNLQLISNADHQRLVTASLTPEQRKAKHEKSQKTRNKSIKRDRLRLKWGLEPEGKLVKRI